MIDLCTYRSAIGSFHAKRGKLARNKGECFDGCFVSKECFLEHFQKYFNLSIVKHYFPTLIKVFESISLMSDVSKESDKLELLLSGDVEQNPGPDIPQGLYNQNNIFLPIV